MDHFIKVLQNMDPSVASADYPNHENQICI